MKVKALLFAVFLVLALLPAASGTQDSDRVHGMIIVMAENAGFFAMPGSALISRRGVEFKVYNWPVQVEIADGRYLVETAYTHAPMFCADLLDASILIAISPSQDGWREAFRGLAQGSTVGTYHVRVGDVDDAKLISMERTRK